MKPIIKTGRYLYKYLRLILICFSILFSIRVSFCQEQKKENTGESISTLPFMDSVHHWYDIFDPENIVNPKVNQPRYKETDITSIADNILLFQKDNGGWPKNYDMQAILTSQQADSVRKAKVKTNTTFDNSTTYTQLEYLAKAYRILKKEKYRNACIKGIQFILDAQYPNGGWPQYYPLQNNYSRHITYNDGAFTGIMELLKKITDKDPDYSFISEQLRNEITAAYNKGIECILNTQIVDNGKLTAWCQQHDEKTLKPAWARAFEPPSIGNGESAPVVLFLMSIKNPDERIRNSIKAAVRWFKDSEILNTRVKTISAPSMRTQWTISTTDRIVVADSSAPLIWTRFYELITRKPLFCDRDSKPLYSLAEVSRERRSGYNYYTYAPQEVLDKYPAWEKENTRSNAGSERFYTNPVLAGDYPDPSIIRVGNDFFMTNSSFNYYPGLLIWHSTDMIHWERICHALHKNVGSVWAPDLVRYNDMFYIYFPAGGTNWVVTAKSPEGPWSDPVDLKLKGYIDPDHFVGPDGKRYLYLSKGFITGLTDDGLATKGNPEFTYAGWKFPETWSTECFCLESPKPSFKDGFFYLTVAEGGTAGPATSHMVVSARASSPEGPWENSPFNPIIHTGSREELWWSQGHGTLVDDKNGRYWIVYHGYEKGFHTLGRQTLMMPVIWTPDKWYMITPGVNSSDSITVPAGEISSDGTSLSDDFNEGKTGLQWQWYKKYSPERIGFTDGRLLMKADGNSFDDSSPLLVNAGDRKYEVTVEFNIDNNVTAGLCLFYNETANVRIAADTSNFTVYVQKNAKIRVRNRIGHHGFLRILNDNNEVSFYFSPDMKSWTRAERSLDATGYNHNVFGEFLSLRAGIYVFGKGTAVFDNFIYNKLR